MARSYRQMARLARRWALRGVRSRVQPHGLILMYHRVDNSFLDPWHCCVSPENFKAHISVLQRLAYVVPLQDLLTKICNGKPRKPVVAITFDDGYVDNLLKAAPVLMQAGFPATVFVVTGWIGDTKVFWWDRLAWILLSFHELPDGLELNTGGLSISWQNTAHASRNGQKLAARNILHQKLWSQLRLLDETARNTLLEQLAAWSGVDTAPRRAGRPMNAPELAQLHSMECFEIGAHTVTHPVLPSLPAEKKAAEIRNSLDDCERLTGCRPRTFAYPYGDLDQDTIDTTRAAGVMLACSTREDLIWPGADTHALPRVAVDDWSGPAFERWLRWYWMLS